jgi:hypothetical protein
LQLIGEESLIGVFKVEEELLSIEEVYYEKTKSPLGPQA